MAGEVMLINPRRRRHRRRRRTAARGRRRTTHRRRRRSNPFMLTNPRRRSRRRYGRRRARRAHRRHHSNPRFGGKFFGIPVGQAVSLGAGFVGSSVLAGYLMGVLPAEWQTPQTKPLVRAGAKVAAGVAGGMLLRTFNRSWGNAFVVGGAIAAVVDLTGAYLLPALGLTLSDYEGGLITGYEQGMLTGTGESGDFVDSTGPYGGSIYG